MSILERMEQEIRDLKKTVFGMKQDMDERLKAQATAIQKILYLLEGVEIDDGNSGMYKRLTRLEDRVKILERWRDRAVWVMLGMAAVAGAGTWSFINKIAELFQ